MTDDLVKRLREYDKPGMTMTEAADRIETLEKALRPFARCAFINPSDGQWYEHSPDYWDGELIAAAIALGENK